MGQIMAQMPIRGVFTPPTVLEELLDTPKGLEMIAQTEFVMYGGGPLAPSAGDRISKVTCLTSAIGSTEAGIIPARVPTKENWSYFEWHPDYEGMKYPNDPLSSFHVRSIMGNSTMQARVICIL